MVLAAGPVPFRLLAPGDAGYLQAAKSDLTAS